MSHPRQVVNGFVRRKPRHVRQTRPFSLAVAAFGMLILSHSTGAQPLGINPSAAPSDIGNPSSINPAARASDVWNPSAINPAAAASQIPQESGRHRTPGARPAPDHPAVACPHPRRDAAERDHGTRLSRAGASEQASTPGRSSGLTWRRAGPSRPKPSDHPSCCGS